MIAFLAYCLQVTLKNRTMIHAPGLTPAAVLEKVATIQMVEVWIPTLDGRWLVLPRHTQPEKDVQAMLDHLHITPLLNHRHASRHRRPLRRLRDDTVLPRRGEDLGVTLTDSERLSQIRTLELRKIG